MNSIWKTICLALICLLSTNVFAMGTRPRPTSVPIVKISVVPQPSEVTKKYGDKAWDQYVWLGAHNAFTRAGDGWIVANQFKSYEELLDFGVRNIDLDIYDFKSELWQCIFSIGADCYARDVYLCHSSCSTAPGFTYALPRKTLSDALSRIAAWMRAHPQEVVTITMESYVSDRALYLAALQRSGALPLVFNTETGRPGGKWPRLSEMVRTNKRLVLLTDKVDNAGSDTLTALDSTIVTKNFWSLGDLGENTKCEPRWNDVPLTNTARAFHMSHFRNIPTALTAYIDNTSAKLRSRILNECYAAAKRYPNFLMLDYADIGDGKAIVDWLNSPGVSP